MRKKKNGVRVCDNYLNLHPIISSVEIESPKRIIEHSENSRTN